MKLAGMIFIVISAGYFGFGMAFSLKKQNVLFRQMLHVLQTLRNEIAFCGTPLPQAFALMAVSCDGELEQLFSQLAKTMNKYPWMSAAEAMQSGCVLRNDFPLKDVCVSLADGLGNYDLDSQLRSIASAKERIEERIRLAEQERGVKSKLYETLGICAGLSLAILLL